jgi:epoxyqueuosine reductase QueG
MTETGREDNSSWVENTILEFIQRSPENNLQDETNEKAWEDALVGFSRGDDPLYTDFKEYVGPFHWTPLEIFTMTFPDIKATPEELTVISWILPQTEATKRDHREQTVYPAERWARARIFGEEFNQKLRTHLVHVLEKAGYEAVAPMLSPEWSRKKSEKYELASTWSERHAAYASGLGTFGLCDGLITPLGKAMRTGSVVARIQIPPSPRPYTSHQEYCAFFTMGICGKCIPRCPVGAITESGHDKTKCFKHTRIACGEYVKTHYGFEGRGCGLCQTNVPCESKIPTKEDVEAYETDQTP